MKRKSQPAPAERADATVAKTETSGALSNADLDKVSGGGMKANSEAQNNVAQALKGS
jgi:hypothetical protein